MTKEMKNVSMQNNSMHINTPNCESVENNVILFGLNPIPINPTFQTRVTQTIPFYKSSNSPKEIFHISGKTKVVIENIKCESYKVATVNIENNMMLYIPLHNTDVFINFISCFEKILLRSMTKKELLNKIKQHKSDVVATKTKSFSKN